ncbi:MAG: MFS transporter [Phycisphaerae bacterium]
MTQPPATPTADTPLLAHHPALFENRNFLLLWAGYVVSALGDRIHFIVMLQLVTNLMIRRTHNPAFEAGVAESAQLTIMMLAPFLLFGPFTGILADRLPRRAIMLTADIARVIIVIAARTLFLRENDVFSITALYGILLASEFILATFAATFSPARLALLPQLVHPTQLLRANSMTNAAGTIASLIGFVIGGAMVKYSLQGAMYADAGTFALSAAFLLLMKLPPAAKRPAVTDQQKAGFFRELADGLAYIWSHKRVLQIILLMLLFWSCGTIILNGLTGIITHHFGLGLNAYANFMGVVGVGMILGAASVSLARRGIPKEVGIAWAMFGVGFFLFFFSMTDRWLTGLFLLVGAAFFGAVLLVSLDTLLQRIVPNFVRGRVMGAKDVITTFGLISVAIPLAIWNDHWGDINELIRGVLFYLSIFVMLVGLLLVRMYYRSTKGLSIPVAISRRVVSAYLSIFKKFDWGNAARIPPTGPVIFVANHTTAYDPLVMQASSKHRHIQFMMAKEYYEMKPFVYLYRALGVIPVNRTGNDTASIRTALRVLKDGGCIGMYPEGKISTDGRMNEGRPGVALLALMSGATVVPAYIRGTNVHAGMVQDFLKRSKVTIFFGRPLRFEDLKGLGRDEAREIAAKRIMDAIIALRDRYETDPERRISSAEAQARNPANGASPVPAAI